MGTKLTKWFIFSVLVSLVPIVCSGIRLLTKGHSFSIGTLWSRGELLLISCAIAAAAVGELLSSGKNLAIYKYIAGGGCVLVLMTASLWYSDVLASVHAQTSYSTKFVSTGSFFLYLFSLLASAACIALSELEQ